MPIPFGIFVGECAHQIRTCLDHLIFLLAKPKPGREKFVQFPLVDKRYKFRGAANSSMPGVPRGVRTIVERLQPYHRRPECKLLGQLKAIDDWDKHRLVLTSAVATQGVQLDVKISGGVITKREIFDRILKPGAIIARFHLANIGDSFQMEVNAKIPCLPVFDSRMPKIIQGRPSVYSLTEIGVLIRDKVLPLFIKFF